MAYFRYRNRNANNLSNRVRFNQPFSFRRRAKVEVEDRLPLNMIISEPASRDQVCPYSTLQECLANSGTMSTKTHPQQQKVHADVLNNFPHNTQYAETKKQHCGQPDEDITFNYREDISYDLNSTCCSESGLKDKPFFSSDRSLTNLESDNDVCTKYPDKRRNLQRTESDILKNINYKKYVPRVQPFLAVFSPKKKKNTSQLQPIKEATKVTNEYSAQPYFEWSKQKFIGQKRRHEFETTHPPVCPKYPDKRRNLQRTESDILKNINYKKYVPRVQPFLAVFSPKKKKNISQLQPIKEANKVTHEYSAQPYFEWSKPKFIAQKRRHEFETTHPPYKVSKNEDSRAELGKLSRENIN